MGNAQERYLNHQKRKKEALSGRYDEELIYSQEEIDTVKKVFTNRRSSRIFNGESVDLKEILEMVETSPSSCDRKAVKYQIVESRDDKELLGGILVGGAGWIHRADKIVLLVADLEDYGSPAEKDFMPYLDAGVMIQSFYLACEVMGVKCCFVNPNIREINKDIFKQRFSDGEPKLFCGAIILGR